MYYTIPTRIRVQVKTVAPGETYLFGSNLNTKVFNKCLGEADYDSSNNVNVPDNYDYGDIYHPHIIKYGADFNYSAWVAFKDFHPMDIL